MCVQTITAEAKMKQNFNIRIVIDNGKVSLGFIHRLKKLNKNTMSWEDASIRDRNRIMKIVSSSVPKDF